MSPPSVQSHLTHRKHSDFRFGAIYYDTSRSRHKPLPSARAIWYHARQHPGRLTQSVRVPDLHSGCRRFESVTAHQMNIPVNACVYGDFLFSAGLGGCAETARFDAVLRNFCKRKRIFRQRFPKDARQRGARLEVSRQAVRRKRGNPDNRDRRFRDGLRHLAPSRHGRGQARSLPDTPRRAGTDQHNARRAADGRCQHVREQKCQSLAGITSFMTAGLRHPRTPLTHRASSHPNALTRNAHDGAISSMPWLQGCRWRSCETPTSRCRQRHAAREASAQWHCRQCPGSAPVSRAWKAAHPSCRTGHVFCLAWTA